MVRFREFGELSHGFVFTNVKNCTARVFWNKRVASAMYGMMVRIESRFSKVEIWGMGLLQQGWDDEDLGWRVRESLQQGWEIEWCFSNVGLYFDEIFPNVIFNIEW